jgi:nucleolar protein 53
MLSIRFFCSVSYRYTQPRIKPLRSIISATAVSAPHQGSSYNPPVDAYKDLLSTAVRAEEKRLKEQQKYDAIKTKIEAAVTNGTEAAVEGMIIDIPGDEDQQDAESAHSQEDNVVPTRPARRKTQQQRRKALQIAQEVSIECVFLSL